MLIVGGNFMKFFRHPRVKCEDLDGCVNKTVIVTVKKLGEKTIFPLCVVALVVIHFRKLFNLHT